MKDQNIAIAVLPDHPTPCKLRTHTSAPVPFVMYRQNGPSDCVDRFDEKSAGKGKFNGLILRDFIDTFLKF
jgi:2,3-bisphosphoglycerate-independent phosphoglycerate mutase